MKSKILAVLTMLSSVCCDITLLGSGLPKLVKVLPEQLESVSIPQLPIVASPVDLIQCYQNILASNSANDPDITRRMPELVEAHGYNVDTHSVTTQDGYILKVFRVRNATVWNKRSANVLLNHALLGSSAQWFLQNGNRNLGMSFADAGYDVWATNHRGTSYSTDHVHFTEYDSEYWDFSWHEMGIYDVPAIIDYILSQTKQSKIIYVGHSMGTTQLFVTLSEYPKYNDKIEIAFLLAPVAYLGHSTTPVRQLAFLMYDGQYLSNPLLGGKIEGNLLTKYFKTSLGDICAMTQSTCPVCNNLAYLLFGYDAPQTDYERCAVFYSKFPDSCSTKSFVHYAQGAANAPQTFRQFDYSNSKEHEKRYGEGVISPPPYDLSKVTIPIIGFYGLNDNLATPSDTKLTFSKLNNPKNKLIEVSWRLFNHFDFSSAKDAKTLVYDHIFNELRQIRYRKTQYY